MGVSAKALYMLKHEEQDDVEVRMVKNSVRFNQFLFRLKVKEEIYVIQIYNINGAVTGRLFQAVSWPAQRRRHSPSPLASLSTLALAEAFHHYSGTLWTRRGVQSTRHTITQVLSHSRPAASSVTGERYKWTRTRVDATRVRIRVWCL
ncbi:hypothetical protein EJ110_NYTH58322 [Nymphaea thermarum]|nr:hypothetical protein EJ110_NYTH58322 [Nymphaea thermarum]